MSWRRQLLVSFGIQGGGAAAVLLGTVWLGAALGPEVQGTFSRSKSEIEFVVAFAMFGLPQALFFFVQSGRLDRRTALRWVGGSALVAVPIGVLWTAARHGAGGALPWLAGAAVAACVAHGQLRALLLVGARTAVFNAVTAAPQLLALVGVAIVVAGAAGGPAARAGAGAGMPSAATWYAVFGIAAGLTALYAWRRLVVAPVGPVGPVVPVATAAPSTPQARDVLNASSASSGMATTGRGDRSRSTDSAGSNGVAGSAKSAKSVESARSVGGAMSAGSAGGPPPTAPAWRPLVRYGLAAWLTATLSTAAILAMQLWVETVGGAAALGRFALALTLVQVPLTPIAYAAPLLLRRWMQRPGALASRRWGLRLFAALLLLAAVVGLASRRWPDLGLGPAYAGTAEMLSVLLVGGAAEAASRVLTVNFSAQGHPWTAVRAELARWGVLGLGGLVFVGLAPGDPAGRPSELLPLCAVWSAAAVAAALVFAVQGRRSGADPAPAPDRNPV